MKITIEKENGYQKNQFCMIEFKGRFCYQNEDENKQLVHIGDLYQIEHNKYRLEMGVMDLVGKSIQIPKIYLMERQPKGQEVHIKIKGVIKSKIIFDKRPVPDMQRAQTQKRPSGPQNIFKHNQLAKQNLSQLKRGTIN